MPKSVLINHLMGQLDRYKDYDKLGEQVKGLIKDNQKLKS